MIIKYQMHEVAALNVRLGNRILPLNGASGKKKRYDIGARPALQFTFPSSGESPAHTNEITHNHIVELKDFHNISLTQSLHPPGLHLRFCPGPAPLLNLLLINPPDDVPDPMAYSSAPTHVDLRTLLP